MTTRQNDGALLEAALQEESIVSGCKFGARTVLTFAGNGEGELIKASIIGKHDIQGVTLSAGKQSIEVEFGKFQNQLHPTMRSATAHCAALKANEISFKPDSPVLFYQPGHIGAGDLSQEICIDGIWFGPAVRQAHPSLKATEAANTSTESSSAEYTSSAASSTATPAAATPEARENPRPANIAEVSLKQKMKPAYPDITLNRDIGFYTTGQVAYGTLSRQQTIDGLTLSAWSCAYFYPSGRLFGGTLAEETPIDGIKCRGMFRLSENGKLLTGLLTEEHVFDGIRCTGEFRLYDNGKILGSTLVGEQMLGSLLCVGHFTLDTDGSPKKIYMGETDVKRGHPYNEGWLLRLSGDRYRGYSSRPPGYWKKESFNFLKADGDDFRIYYYTQAVICSNNSCECHSYGKIESYNFYSELRNYQRKGWALMNQKRYAEAEVVQTKVLDMAIRYQRLFGGEMLAELCCDAAKRLMSQNHLNDAAIMIERAESYWQQYGKDRRYYQVRQCRIIFQKCQIFSQLNNFGELEPLVRTIITMCETDTENRLNSLGDYDYSEAEKMLGDCLAERGEFTEAETHYEKSLSLIRDTHNAINTLRAYHALLVKTNQMERASLLASRIEDIERTPVRIHLCGNGYAQEAAWLAWKPNLKLD